MKRSFRFLAVLLLMALALAGCGAEKTPAPAGTPAEPQKTETPAQTSGQEPQAPAEPEQKVDYEAYCKKVLDHAYEVLASAGEIENQAGELGIWEMAIMMGSGQAALENVGYTLTDINGDEIPELIISPVDSIDKNGASATQILVLYSCKGDAPDVVLEGWARNSFSLLNDGTIFRQGSGSAFCSIFSTLRLSSDGKRAEFIDNYFSDMKIDDPETIVFYHNTTGEAEASESEALDLTEDQFWAMAEKLSGKTCAFSVTPFAEYAYDGTVQIAEGAFYSDIPASTVIGFADELLADYSEFVEFTADGTEFAGDIVFAADAPIADVKVLALTFADVDSNGKIIFDTEELTNIGMLNPGTALLVHLTFAGTIPNYGISYIDCDGTERHYAIGESGFDGSLYLEEF